MSRTAPRPLLLVDGECVFCNWVLRFVHHVDAEGRLAFGHLQAPVVQRLARELPGLPTDVSTVVLVAADRRRFWVRSTAVFRALAATRSLTGSAARVALAVVPTVLADAAYDAFAQIRYRVFGRTDGCPVDPGMRARFADDALGPELVKTR